MNTSPITSSTQASNGDASKTQFRDATSNTSFSAFLTKEIAERNSTDSANTTSSKETSSQNKQENPVESSSTSAKPADDSQSKETNDTEQTSTDPSAEQALMMAAQFIPVNLQTEVTTSSPDSATSAFLTTIGASGLPAELSADTDLIDNPMQTPIDLAGTATPLVNTGLGKDKSNMTVSNFNTALNQAAEEQTARTKEGLPLSSDLSVQKQSTDSALENIALPSAGQTIGESATDAAKDTQPNFSAALASLQQATASNAQAVSANASDKIGPHIGSSAWNQAVGQKIVWMIGNEQQSASLTLNPPDLGPMHVVLSVSSTHANASFYSPHAEVREALEAALPKLREMLGDAGIQLGQASVNSGSPQQQGNYAANSLPSMRAGAQTSDILMTTPQAATGARILKEGLIDTFA